MSNVSPLDIRNMERLDLSKRTETAGSTKLGKDEFLKLLMAQLGNQDPTAPTDSQAFVAQLAQFTTLELMTNSNSHLEHLLVGQAAQQQTSTVNLVGKDILFRTDTLTLTGGKPSATQATLSDAASTVSVVITDENGKTIRTMQLGERAAGTFDVVWDGRDEKGVAVPDGTYKVRVAASDKSNNAVGVEQRGRGSVTGLSLEDGVPELLLGTRRIKLLDVIEVNERSGQ
jgi:flagellar basal-body rod modification protein FlgD